MNLFIVGAAGVAGLVALLFGVGTMLPAEWAIQRSTTIGAPAAVVYSRIASFRTGWAHWNPWLESSMTITYSGPEAGVGATQSWTGGDTKGGTITITSADAARGIDFSLDFGPFPIRGRIAMAEDGNRTLVTWANSGTIAGLPVYRFMRFGLGRFVGVPMDRGLADLKNIAESGEIAGQ
jgi:hypothetical protein